MQLRAAALCGAACTAVAYSALTPLSVPRTPRTPSLCPPPPHRYDFFQASPLLGGTSYETEFDYGGTKVFVTTCMVEG